MRQWLRGAMDLLHVLSRTAFSLKLLHVMTTKKSNALKRQQYGIALPLLCLQQDSLQPSLETKDQCAQKQILRSRWKPLNEILRYVSIWTRQLYPQSGNLVIPPELIQAEFHPLGRSVWVKNENDMEKLFRQGFFGKGTLSRSEATWRQRIAGDAQGMRLEDITRQRRIERARLKEQKTSSPSGLLPTQTSGDPSPSSLKPSVIPLIDTDTTSSGQLQSTAAPSKITSRDAIATDGKKNINAKNSEENYEHLQLSLEEAMFLVFAIECIYITTAAATTTTKPVTMSIQECWLKFIKACNVNPTMEITVDNPFIVRYAAYHHYRSQGWVVKDGLKYGSDFLLYRKGMVFGHSQYAIKVISCNSQDEHQIGASKPLTGTLLQPFLSSTPGICQPHPALSWQWLLTINRVVSQVQKTVILCHVLYPSHATKKQLSHPRTALPLYKVAEIGIKRFIPERNRT
ncbi:tRNA splicing endonuclease subunit sen2 [Lobosporangium transversale]|uniref:tRNA-splicing endonuclease subunit Sen2 n=1 Tax=Lobosporangium transversale TaxID=64571 RepID=A0A1Y2GBM8_9FUNG|nr:hypothetical protein BCR41DRAFT_169385 [Lobosporangium transversale]KAF9914901.1 tRNA splicing endonuclease subunit sen2 [Lobosporangium transversale]ORZ06361.1 hypothetical protein BCR41DRAFT_169385 [Lobosporangium transversale]|eukprot:XP_021877524.1 hypothetical protein BCR41DRAFT_169385 [Lobosporangium transversale]